LEAPLKKFALLVLIVVAACPILALAKPKEKTYDATPERVYEAALRTAKMHHNVTYIDDKHLMFTFQTGSSAMSYGYECNASVEKAGEDKATLYINTQKKTNSTGKGTQLTTFGAGGRMADKFFDWVTEELAKGKSAKEDKAIEKKSE
jgi:hypothetical protein